MKPEKPAVAAVDDSALETPGHIGPPVWGHEGEEVSLGVGDPVASATWRTGRLPLKRAFPEGYGYLVVKESSPLIRLLKRIHAI